jgi:uncharacterized protein YjbI with pentapeptide repeats
MANPEHLAKLKEGGEAWNQWRKQNLRVKPDLREAVVLYGVDLSKANLRKANLNGAHLIDANLSGANLSKANLREASLDSANLTGADLSKADLSEASLSRANLTGVDLGEAILSWSDLVDADLREADLTGARLCGTNLVRANLIGANLSEATLMRANLNGANLSGADLKRADLTSATLVETNLEGANLTGCSVYGASAWNVRLEGAIQSNLVITRSNESLIQVDNLEVAQFIYLLLNNEKIRSVIDTITSKVVLILGRFTPERKVVLDAIRGELRKRDYLPVLFDFEKPASKDLTGTISTLANIARFIIADLTDPSSVPHELATLVPSTVVPVQTITWKDSASTQCFPTSLGDTTGSWSPTSTSPRNC